MSKAINFHLGIDQNDHVHVLIVEDHMVWGELISNIVRDIGATPLWAVDFEHAQDLLTTCEVSVLVLDLALPDSETLLGRILLQIVADDIPVVVVSGVLVPNMHQFAELHNNPKVRKIFLKHEFHQGRFREVLLDLLKEQHETDNLRPPPSDFQRSTQPRPVPKEGDSQTAIAHERQQSNILIPSVLGVLIFAVIMAILVWAARMTTDVSLPLIVVTGLLLVPAMMIFALSIRGDLSPQQVYELYKNLLASFSRTLPTHTGNAMKPENIPQQPTDTETPTQLITTS